ncbi:MAG: hypothetical protein GOMPHAMPRED_006748 [Gomphillus americanus]|uniref:Uncharacterized protein n=1 Tax=Gomphillus americanus TaxID=1940652 RepID=A0A8H3EV23_9LECA|nr:MAG: hypothetical protein GOMPHAMPRED_006748 [Gomphillus americanus]
MSPSPSKEADTEPADHTPENHRQTTGSDDERPDERPDPDNQFTEMDVKEQDRWLPIANG